MSHNFVVIFQAQLDYSYYKAGTYVSGLHLNSYAVFLMVVRYFVRLFMSYENGSKSIATTMLLAVGVWATYHCHDIDRHSSKLL